MKYCNNLCMISSFGHTMHPVRPWKYLTSSSPSSFYISEIVISKHALVVDLAAVVFLEAHKITDSESFSITLAAIDSSNLKARALFRWKDYLANDLRWKTANYSYWLRRGSNAISWLKGQTDDSEQIEVCLYRIHFPPNSQPLKKALERSCLFCEWNNENT